MAVGSIELLSSAVEFTAAHERSNGVGSGAGGDLKGISPHPDGYLVRVYCNAKTYSDFAKTLDDAIKVREALLKKHGKYRIGKRSRKPRENNTGLAGISDVVLKKRAGYGQISASVTIRHGKHLKRCFCYGHDQSRREEALQMAIDWRSEQVALWIKEIIGSVAVPYAEVQLAVGGVALVDAADAKLVEGYNWTWMKGRGVAAFFKDQTVLMHNLIAPHEKVSFRNGDKRDCRRANLTNMDHSQAFGGKVGGRTGDNIYLDKKGLRYEAYRKIHEGGVVHSWRTTVAFGKIRTQREAKVMALQVADALLAMSREDFIEFCKFSKGKKTTNQIVSEWDVFGGTELSMSEVKQFGMFNNRED